MLNKCIHYRRIDKEWDTMTVSAGKWEVEDGTQVVVGHRLVANTGGYSDNYSFPKDANKANATLIVTAVNACKSLNESDPQAVADKIVQAFEALKNLLDVFPQEYEQQNKEWIRDAKAVLSSVGGK